MDHSQFKANQTAAVYVADGLDAPTQEAFEMHMMDCPECIEDVETWRAIKVNIPSRVRLANAGVHGSRSALRSPSSGTNLGSWRLAASVVFAGAVGTTIGWFGREARSPELDGAHSVFFNMPATERGAECSELRLSPDAKVAVVRVPGIGREQTLVAVDSEQRPLAGGTYSVRMQPDASRVMRIQTQVLVDRAVHLETRNPQGVTEPIGCITGSLAE